MEATIDYLGGKQFAVYARGHSLISDQPAGNHGDDNGMTPPELMLASLGTCAGYYAVEYLNLHTLPAAGLRIRVTAEKTTAPARLGAFHIDVEAPGAEEPRHHAGLLKAVERCLIHNTLTHPPVIEVKVEQLATI